MPAPLQAAPVRATNHPFSSTHSREDMMPSMVLSQQRMRWALMLTSLLWLGGCANTSIQDSLQTAGRLAHEPAQWIVSDAQRAAVSEQVNALLSKPLSMDDAVGLAWRHSRAVQTLLSAHAAAVADIDASARLPNPQWAFERLIRGDSTELTRTLSIGLTELITLPQRQRLAKAHTQAQVIRTAQQLAWEVAQTRKLWIMAVAALQTQRYYDDVYELASAGDALAEQMARAGNISALQRAREAQFLSDALLQRRRAGAQALVARERLIRQLGLDRDQAQRLQLPDQLPALPKALRSAEQTATRALEERLDIQLARAELLAIAQAQGITQITSWIDGLHLAGIRQTETGEAPWKGFELSLPLPLFDWGDARRAGGQARYLAQLNQTAQTAIDAQSQVAQTHAVYASSFDIAQHHQATVLPTLQRIADENIYRYNGMLMSVFNVLADARAHIAGVIGAIDAQRDFWLADVELDNTLLGLASDAQGIAPLSTASNDKAAH